MPEIMAKDEPEEGGRARPKNVQSGPEDGRGGLKNRQGEPEEV